MAYGELGVRGLDITLELREGVSGHAQLGEETG